MTIRPTLSYAPPAASRPEAAAPSAPAEAQKSQALSAAERQALATQFPEAPDLALRLYGPTGRAAEPAPTLGTRLDLRG